MTRNVIEHPLGEQGFLVLDGALATELERRGANIDDPLWSAKVLLDDPSLIEDLHYDYFVAGADVAITASYQASFAGFAARGLDEKSAASLMRRSVDLALRARERFLAAEESRGRLRPLVAASIGPYGATLHDGSEYRGDYGLSVLELMAWHRPRLQVLAGSGADLLACETIPCLAEVEALTRLLDECAMPAWISVSARGEGAISHGESIREAAALADDCAPVVAFGINCTAPRFIEPLLRESANATDKPLLCYPNSGERWDAATGCWLAGAGVTDFAEPARRWFAAGARLIGGCCRTGPSDVASIRACLTREASANRVILVPTTSGERERDS
jgi:homocysteine S-methyltransferase